MNWVKPTDGDTMGLFFLPFPLSLHACIYTGTGTVRDQRPRQGQGQGQGQGGIYRIGSEWNSELGQHHDHLKTPIRLILQLMF